MELGHYWLSIRQSEFAHAGYPPDDADRTVIVEFRSDAEAGATVHVVQVMWKDKSVAVQTFLESRKAIQILTKAVAEKNWISIGVWTTVLPLI